MGDHPARQDGRGVPGHQGTGRGDDERGDGAQPRVDHDPGPDVHPAEQPAVPRPAQLTRRDAQSAGLAPGEGLVGDLWHTSSLPEPPA
ncbi:MAG: hypothetical protein WB473_01880, partial [Pedococcus sp.]